jgi:hypothetical protein
LKAFKRKVENSGIELDYDNIRSLYELFKNEYNENLNKYIEGSDKNILDKLREELV